MKKVIIHIGTDKTGSTAIQHSLSGVRSELSKVGVNYVSEKTLNHGYVYQAAKNENWHVVEDVLREITSSSCTTHVISFEGLYHLAGEKLKKFMSFFKGFEVEVVIYLRSRYDKMRSGLAQRLKFESGYDERFFSSLYGVEDLELVFSKVTFDYKAIVDRWEGALLDDGCSKLDLNIYDRSELVGGDVVVDFFSKLNLGEERAKYLLELSSNQARSASSANPSISPAAQDLLALCTLLSSEKSTYQVVRDIIEREDPHEEKKDSRLPGSIVESFSFEFDEGDKELARKYFARENLFKGGCSFRYGQVSSDIFYDLAKKVLSEHKKLAGKVGGSSGEVLDSFVPYINKAVERLEKGDADLAFRLLRLAKEIRPGGPWINSKIKEYNSLSLEDVGPSFYLDNDERVGCYFKVGSDIENAGIEFPEPADFYSADKPMCINFSKNELSVDSVIEESYLSDFMEFVRENDAISESFFAQFGDGDPKRDKKKIIFCKARSIGLDVGSSVLLKLNKPRHWNMRKGFDQLGWFQKNNSLVWRGNFTGIKDIHRNRRVGFVERYFKKFDVGAPKIGQIGDDRVGEFVVPFLSRSQQLACKYVVSLEGNDVASNLKWILASNSVPIMPKPKKESWLLESKLVPYVHYVPLNDALDDLEEVYEWCLNNDDHCKQIAENGKRYMEMFFDEENEKEIYRMIYQRYKNIIDG